MGPLDPDSMFKYLDSDPELGSAIRNLAPKFEIAIRNLTPQFGSTILFNFVWFLSAIFTKNMGIYYLSPSTFDKDASVNQIE